MPKRKNITPEESAIADDVYSKIGHLKTYKNISKVLRNNGYIRVNGGGFKSVFKKPHGKYCIKVYHHYYAWQDDSYYAPPRVASKHYLHPIYKSKVYLIQKWAKRTVPVKQVNKLPKKLYAIVNDLHEDNIKIDKDREVIIDYCT